MRNIKVLQLIILIQLIVILLLVSIIGVRYMEDNEKHYGFYFNHDINIPPVGKEANLLLNSIASINTVFESEDGDAIVMFSDGRLVYLPVKEENSFSQFNSVEREEGYWMMKPSYTTELIINKVVLSNGNKEKVDISVTTHFIVENPEDTEFEITNKSKIKLLEKNFHLKDSFKVKEANEKISIFLK